MGKRKADCTPEEWQAHLAGVRTWRLSEAGRRYADGPARAWREAHAGYPHEEIYARLMAEQGGVCAICHKPESRNRRLSLDHDHACCPTKTSCGKCIRGLLCDRCNRAIAHLGEELLMSAIEYLMKPSTV